MSDKTSEMVLGQIYGYKELGLTDVVSDLCQEIETWSGEKIIFLYSPKTAKRLFGDSGPQTAGCIVTEKEAVVVSVVPALPMRTVYHELLHIRLVWVEKQKRIWGPSGSAGQPFIGWGNDLEHLSIIMAERTYFETDEHFQHWEREYGDPNKFNHNVSQLQKRQLMMGFAIAKQILNESSLEQWDARLNSEGIREEAIAFANKLLAAGGKLDERWRVVLRGFNQHAEKFRFRQIDIKSKSATISSIDD